MDKQKQNKKTKCASIVNRINNIKSFNEIKVLAMKKADTLEFRPFYSRCYRVHRVNFYTTIKYIESCKKKGFFSQPLGFLFNGYPNNISGLFHLKWCQNSVLNFSIFGDFGATSTPRVAGAGGGGYWLNHLPIYSRHHNIEPKVNDISKLNFRRS